MSTDGIKEHLARFVRSTIDPLDYLAMYPARIAAQQAVAPYLVDVQPDDKRLPGLQGVPLRLGIPEATAQVALGSRVLVGFENGDPAKPYAAAWDAASLTTLTIGGGADYVALATLVKAELQAIRTAFNTHVHSGVTTGPGSSAVPVVAMGPAGDVKATKVKVT